MRVTNMKQQIEILSRLRKGCGINEINRELGAHKTVIRQVRNVATEKSWIAESDPIPSEDELNAAYRATFSHKKKSHYLDAYKESIKTWREHDESFVVISHKISRLLEGKRVPESTLRDYFHREIGTAPKVVIRRTNEEMGVAELDFGYLGVTYNNELRCNKKTWFVSLRFRNSRKAVRRKLYICDTLNVLAALSSIFKELDGVPSRLVIDNFKVAITKASKHDPTESQAFRQFSLHYGFLIDPCGPNQPQQKGGVENDVKYVKKNFWPLFRFDEEQIGHTNPHGKNLDDALKRWDEEIASVRKIREAGNLSPKDLFCNEFEHLLTLPQGDFEPYNEQIIIVKTDFHITCDNASYSVPYKLTGKKVLIKTYAHKILVFYKGELVSQHSRSYKKGSRVTEKTHRPPNMTAYLEKSMPWLMSKAEDIGEHTTAFIKALAEDKVVYRKNAIIGTVKLKDKYGSNRLEKACARALRFGNIKYSAPPPSV